MAQAKIIIKGENQLSPAIKSAQGDMNGFAQSAQKLGNTLKSAFAITAIIASLKQLGDAAKQCFNDFTSAERSYKQLALAIRDTSAYEQVVKTIDTLSRQTLSSKNDIESMVAELAALGKSADEINKISTAAVALSNVTGKDLNSSMTTLLNTYNGTTTALNRLGIDTSNLTKEQLEQGEAIQLVIDKLGDYSTAMAEADSSQHIQNIKNNWGDIKQAIGGIIDYNFKDWFKKLDEESTTFKDKIINGINYFGAIIKNFPEVAKMTLKTIWEMIKKTFEWQSLKTIFTAVIENIVNYTMLKIKTVFITIPSILKQVGIGILDYIAYIGVNLKNVIGQAIEDLLNLILFNSKNWPLWLKKLLGMDEEGGVFNFHIDPSSADIWKQKADAAFEEIPGIMVEAGREALKTFNEIKTNSAEAFDSVYGEIVGDFKENINALLKPTLEEIKTYSDATNQSKILGNNANTGGTTNTGLEGAANELTNTVDSVNEVVKRYKGLLDYGLTDVQKATKVYNILTDELKNGKLTLEERQTLEAEIAAAERKIIDLKAKEAKAQQDIIKSYNEWRNAIIKSNNEALNPLGTLVNNLFGKGGRYSKSYWSTETYTDENGNTYSEQKYNMGGSESALWQGLTSVVSDLLSEFSSFIDAIISGCWWLAALIEVAKGFAAEIKPFLTQVLGPIKDLLQQFGAALARASIFDELISLVQTFLPVIRSMMNIVTPLVSIITTISRILTATLMPVFKALAYVLVTITGTFEWVIAWFKYWIDSFCNWLASIDILGWRPFGGLQRTATKPSSYGEFMSGKYAAIDAGVDTTYDASAATSVSNASYTGATSVTINIYQQAPVVGDGGMLQFAQMIRDSFEQLDYYGVSA